MTLILMGDWCSESWNPNPKETSAKVKTLVTNVSTLARKNIFSSHQDSFFLLTGAF